MELILAYVFPLTRPLTKFSAHLFSLPFNQKVWFVLLPLLAEMLGVILSATFEYS